MGKIETPELEKMSAVSKESNSIGRFLDWMRENKSVVFAHRATKEEIRDYRSAGEECSSDTLIEDHFQMEPLLAEYFKIDLEKCEKERRALLGALNGV